MENVRIWLMVALVLPTVAGCLQSLDQLDTASESTLGEDRALVLPDLAWYDVQYDPSRGYHTLEEVLAHVDGLADTHPDITRVETLGYSNEDRPIRALVITGPGDAASRPAPVVDGGHHANEVEGIESVLFLADFLLANYATNASVRDLVDTHEIWLVPLVNPDGYVVQTRTNANGVNLNRNYDVAWCEPGNMNTCHPPPLQDVQVEYAGPEAFSEPESRAIRDLVLTLGDRLTSYVTHHTDLHCVFGPWVAREGPFPIPEAEHAVMRAVYAWTIDHTEFGAGEAAWGTGECVGYNHGGGSMDWVYATARVPSFTMETAGNEEREGVRQLGPTTTTWERDLPHWMKATLPWNLFMLHNADRLKAWDTDLQQPYLPEGSP